VTEAVVVVFEHISQDDDDDDLQPHRAGRGPETKEIRETEGGKGASHHPQKEDARGIDGQRRVRQRVANVSPDLAIAAHRPIGAVRQSLLDRQEHADQHEGRGRCDLRKPLRAAQQLRRRQPGPCARQGIGARRTMRRHSLA
jgi:hypothetical protein